MPALIDWLVDLASRAVAQVLVGLLLGAIYGVAWMRGVG
jgi:hypothetical protein